MRGDMAMRKKCPYLSLGVNEERPALGVLYNHAVLGGQRVLGQAADLPGADLHRVAHGVEEAEVLGVRHVEVLQLLGPHVEQVRPVLPREGAQVRHVARRDHHVPHEAHHLLLQRLTHQSNHFERERETTGNRTLSVVRLS